VFLYEQEQRRGTAKNAKIAKKNKVLKRPGRPGDDGL
jgi:hypothetical protein